MIRMLTRDTLILLRIPFSIFLAPIYFFALGQAQSLDLVKTILIFVALHLFLYPASNGLNSYFDKDEGSIGGVERPPKPTENLFFWAMVFDMAALVVAAFVSPWFALMLFVYGMLSKFYSWDVTRWKKYPLFSWTSIGVIQGAFTFVAVALFCTPAPVAALDSASLWVGAAVISLFFMAGYPLTQVYQHEEDGKRGDRTISMLLGIRGTFLFAAGLFLLATAGFVYYYAILQAELLKAILYVAVQSPLAVYFSLWMFRVFRDPAAANFRGVLWMNVLSTSLMNVFFLTALFF